jgi:hypothetical protein
VTAQARTTKLPPSSSLLAKVDRKAYDAVIEPAEVPLFYDEPVADIEELPLTVLWGDELERHLICVLPGTRAPLGGGPRSGAPSVVVENDEL